MSVKSEAERNQIIRKYLQQQIYLEPDTIIDRTNKLRFPASGSGEVISKMVDIFHTHVLKYEFKEKMSTYFQLIEDLADELGFEAQPAKDHFSSRMDNLKESEVKDESLYMMMCLSGIIETFQNKVVRRLILRLKRKSSDNLSQNVDKNLDILLQRADSSFSLLINIEIVKEMSRLVGVHMEPIITDHLENQIIKSLHSN